MVHGSGDGGEGGREVRGEPGGPTHGGLTLFLDNTNPPRLVQILCTLGLKAEHLKDRFPANTPDVEWMPQVATLGVVVLTADRRIMTVPSERLEATKLTMFFLPKAFSSWKLRDQAWKLIKCLDDIEKAAKGANPGTWFDVQENGTIKRLSK